MWYDLRFKVWLLVKRPGLNLGGEAVWLMVISYGLVDQGFDS